MAVDGYVPIVWNPGDCVPSTGPNSIAQFLQSIEALAQEIRGKGNVVRCKSVVGSVSASIGEEACFELEAGDILSSAAPDKKILLLTTKTSDNGFAAGDESGGNQFDVGPGTNFDTFDGFDNSVTINDGGFGGGGGNANNLTVSRSIVVKCGGDIIYSGEFDASQPLQFECPGNERVEVCFTTNTAGAFASGTTLYELCGSMLCITECGSDSLTGYKRPFKIQEGCSVGRSGLNLIYQNLTAVCRSLQACSQTQECYTQEYDDDQTHVLATGFQNPLQYLVLGSVRVCAKIAPSREGALTVRPAVGCGGENSACLSGTAFLDGNTGSIVDREICLDIPVSVCGDCLPGDSLFAGFDLVIDDCNGEPDPFSVDGQVEIVTVEQSYCIYTWENISIPELIAFSRPNTFCPSAEDFKRLTDKLDALHKYVCNWQNINCNIQSNRVLIEGGGCIELSSAVVPPPPPPVPIIGDRKIWVDINLCYTKTVFNNAEDLFFGSAIARIFCGATEIKVRDIRWQFTDGSGNKNEKQTLRVRCCLTCPTDEAIEICPQIFSPGLVGNGQVEVNWTSVSF